ncbi:AraC family transcriptional regulator [bacterium]|nr:MAG: AraC family transcriptional regulator [bacterium]
MTSDPLSDILSLIDARSVITGGIRGGGSWAVRFPPPQRIKLYVIAKGTGWMVWEGGEPPLRLQTGDVVLVAELKPFTLASDLEAVPFDAHAVFSHAENGFVTLGKGDDFLMIGGHVALDPVLGGLLLDALPPYVHVRGTSPEAVTVGALLPQLIGEVQAARAGRGLATALLTQLVFLQVLRSTLSASAPLAKGWLRALADERIAPTLHLMHAEPSRVWSLEELAKAASMSRSAFALRFKTAAGVAPLTYLTDWRMRLAERALREGDMPVSSLAYSLGYTSESAFSNAFKRIVGVAPKHYRNREYALEERADTLA